MSGTREGGLKARDTIRQRNPGHYSTIGKVGGKKGNPKTKGFASNRLLAREAGAKGGKISRRRSKTE